MPIQVLDVEERNSSSASASNINTDLQGYVISVWVESVVPCTCIVWCCPKPGIVSLVNELCTLIWYICVGIYMII